MTTLIPDPHRNILIKLTEQQIKDLDIVAKHDGFNTRMAFIRRILLKQIDLHKQKHPEWFNNPVQQPPTNDGHGLTNPLEIPSE